MPKRPYVLVNMAMTADGKIDTVERAGARISGAADTARVDRLRAEADAVLVGGHTLLREDPRLTVRDPALAEERLTRGRTAQPLKVGVVSHIGVPGQVDALPAASRFLTEGGGPVVICTTSRTSPDAIAWLEARGARVMVHGTERVHLAETIEGLRGMGVERLMVEGGSTIVAALLSAGIVDEIQFAVAPLIFGGETAPTPVGGKGSSAVDAVGLSLAETYATVDGDVVVRYLVGTSAPA